MQQNEDRNVKIINVNNSTKGCITNGAFGVFENGLGEVRSKLEDIMSKSIKSMRRRIGPDLLLA